MINYPTGILSTTTRGFPQPYLNGVALTIATNWATANKAFYVRMFFPFSVVVTKIWWVNGTTVAGNVDAGIFDGVTYARIASTGSTAQAGTNTVQSVTLATPVKLKPGSYLFGLATDTTTNCKIGTYPTFDAGFAALESAYQQVTAFPLPATATPVAQTAGFIIPAMGVFTNQGAY